MASPVAERRIGARIPLEEARRQLEATKGPNNVSLSQDLEASSMSIARPALLLRLEGAAVLIGAVVLYWNLEASWLLFALLLFAPDLAMLGYLGGQRTGAAIYNLGHTSLLAIVLVVAGVLAEQSGMAAVGLIWLAHIGMDRMIGYGLKYPGGFKETHLARV